MVEESGWLGLGLDEIPHRGDLIMFTHTMSDWTFLSCFWVNGKIEGYERDNVFLVLDTFKVPDTWSANDLIWLQLLLPDGLVAECTRDGSGISVWREDL